MAAKKKNEDTPNKKGGEKKKDGPQPERKINPAIANYDQSKLKWLELTDQELEVHPLNTKFRVVSGVEAEALDKSVAERGVAKPIILWQGKILNGKGRYFASRKVGQPCPAIEWDGTEAEALEIIMDEDWRRRHLKPKEMAAPAVELAKAGKSQHQIAKILGISVGSVNALLNQKPEPAEDKLATLLCKKAEEAGLTLSKSGPARLGKTLRAVVKGWKGFVATKGSDKDVRERWWTWLGGLLKDEDILGDDVQG